MINVRNTIFNLNITQTIFPLFIIALSGLFGIIEDLTKISAKTGYDFFKFNPSNNFLIKGIRINFLKINFLSNIKINLFLILDFS